MWMDVGWRVGCVIFLESFNIYVKSHDSHRRRTILSIEVQACVYKFKDFVFVDDYCRTYDGYDHHKG